jgi:transcriptional regulator with XRE-family HTH domain
MLRVGPRRRSVRISWPPVAGDVVPGELEDIGTRLKEERERVRISQRELARRLGVSASLISQIESGQSKPSVSTLYALVTELGVSLDHVFRGHADGRAEDGGPGHVPEPEADPVVHPGDRHVIDLASGVRWERLTSHQQEAVDFLHVVYELGGSSSPDDKLMRHAGREYGYVISGTLNVQIGFTERELGPGDSIAFDSTQPHRLWNEGAEPVHGIWFVVGRTP